LTEDLPYIIAGDSDEFAIAYAFMGDDRTTEIRMLVHGANLLGFTQDGERRTTRWPYLEDLVAWLDTFSRTMKDDPYPLQVEGKYAVDKDANARTFETDDLDALDAYYEPLNEWCWNHSWLSERGGAVLPNVLFELKGGMVEISWDNRNAPVGVKFDCEFGGDRVDADAFRRAVADFASAYEKHWGIDIHDENTWAR